MEELKRGYISCLCGVDEVGRGPLAGPVVAASALLKTESEKEYLAVIESLLSIGVTDSKKMSKKRREQVLLALGLTAEELVSGQKIIPKNPKFEPIIFSISQIEADRIDEINILRASLEAMRESVSFFKERAPIEIWVDGKFIFEAKKSDSIEAMVKGDSRSVMIGIASIIAKIYRDHLMERYDSIYPGYGLKKHAGYPTKSHYQAIKSMGITPIHRKSFKGVLS